MNGITRRVFLKLTSLFFAGEILRRNLLVSAVLSSARRVSHFVDATLGNDSNPGIQAAPWKTLAKVETSALPNSAVYFKRGEGWTVAGLGAALLTMPRANLLLDAYGSGADPVFDGGGTFRNVITIPAGITNTLTRHLNLINGGGGTGALWNNSGGVGTVNRLDDSVLDTHATDACATSSVGSSSVLRRCELTGFADDGFTCHGLNGVGSAVEIYDTLIYGGFDGLNHSVTNGGNITTLCEGVTFYNNSSHDIGSLDVGTHTFNRCLFGLPGQTQSASIGGGSPASILTLNYCIINGITATGNALPSLGMGTYNNCTFRGNPAISGKTGTVNSSDASTVITIRNSLFSQWFRLAFISAGEVNADYCLEHLINTGTLTTNTNRIGTNATDPLFVDPTNGDFRLQVTSPARNSGTTYAGQLTTDYAGNAVQSPPSLGALEYVG